MVCSHILWKLVISLVILITIFGQLEICYRISTNFSVQLILANLANGLFRLKFDATNFQNE